MLTEFAKVSMFVCKSSRGRGFYKQVNVRSLLQIVKIGLHLDVSATGFLSGVVQQDSNTKKGTHHQRIDFDFDPDSKDLKMSKHVHSFCMGPQVPALLSQCIQICGHVYPYRHFILTQF